jgi:hypothetical protein
LIEVVSDEAQKFRQVHLEVATPLVHFARNTSNPHDARAVYANILSTGKQELFRCTIICGRKYTPVNMQFVILPLFEILFILFDGHIAAIESCEV